MVHKTQNVSIVKRVMGAVASIALLLSLTMCEIDYCNENMYIVGTMKAFHKKSKSQLGGLVLAARNANGDIISYITQNNGSYSSFLLNPDSDTSRFYVMTGDSSYVLSRIAIVHRNRCDFVNAECGVRILSTIDTVLFEDGVEGDSVAIKMRDVDEKYDNENIEIYLAGFE